MREWMEVGGPGFWCWVSTSLHGSWRVADLFREGLGQGGGYGYVYTPYGWTREESEVLQI